MSEKLFNDRPFISTAISGVYATKAANEEIVLHNGNVEVEGHERVTVGSGRLTFVWLPEPNIQVEIKLNLFDTVRTKSVRFRLPGGADFFDINQPTYGFSPGYCTLRGTVSKFVAGNADAVTRVIFHIPNFMAFSCGAARHNQALVSLGDWRITFAPVEGFNDYDQFRLEQQKSHAITHTGQLEKAGHQTFTVSEARDLLKSIGLWLSFCRGNWTLPLFPVGFNAGGEPVWKDWSRIHIPPSKPVTTWVPNYNLTFLEQGFVGFHKLTLNPLWTNTLPLAIAWYVECNRRESGTEAAIILAQAGLELLSWTYLVKDRKTLSSRKFRDTKAKDHLNTEGHIRLLLDSCGIPCDIPTTLTELRHFAADRQDGAASLVQMRNRLVHPNPDRANNDNPNEAVRIEVWKLALWYLEEVLLRVVGFSGPYRNRTEFTGIGGPSEYVPLAL
jgi:hypothetical protein